MNKQARNSKNFKKAILCSNLVLHYTFFTLNNAVLFSQRTTIQFDDCLSSLAILHILKEKETNVEMVLDQFAQHKERRFCVTHKCNKNHKCNTNINVIKIDHKCNTNHKCNSF